MAQTASRFPNAGPVLALDLGQKLVGVAASDELLISITRLAPLKRSSWKRLLQDVLGLIQRFDAQALVIGLPLRLDGSFGYAARHARHVALSFAQTLYLPVYLQDERLTSFEARANLLAEGHKPKDIPALIDGEAAAIILRDFLSNTEARMPVTPKPHFEDEVESGQ